MHGGGPLRLRAPFIAAPRSGGDASWLIHPTQGQAIEIAYRLPTDTHASVERPHMMYTVYTVGFACAPALALF